MSDDDCEHVLKALSDIATAKYFAFLLAQKKASTNHNEARRYKLKIFDLNARHPTSQMRTEEIMAYSAEDAVFQFRLRNEGVFTQPPTVDSVEPA